MNFLKSGIIFFFLTTTFFLAGCGSSEKSSYTNGIDEWHKKRVSSLTREDNWLSLAGLFWLNEGQNRFGSDTSNDIVFPEKAPGFIGSLILEDNHVLAKINADVNVTAGENQVTSMILRSDADGDPTILTSGSLSWFIIKRGNKYGIRLRDREHPNLKHFKGINRYAVKESWRVQAKLEPYNPQKTIAVPTILGTVDSSFSPGALVFEIAGETYRLDPIADPGDDKYFVIFADDTNGDETYGAGRFLYVDRPGADGITYIDFNKAYNPPCAFTEFATCPLPPFQNRMPVKVTAGEKNYDSENL
ncbi:MAG: DUF1684 domain-containing protein [Calditrichaceae bacterium]